eukprot:COSAG04_NODE_5172_length_1713_cov_3.344486_1_plen_50_part_10
MVGEESGLCPRLSRFRCFSGELCRLFRVDTVRVETVREAAAAAARVVRGG